MVRALEILGLVDGFLVLFWGFAALGYAGAFLWDNRRR